MVLFIYVWKTIFWSGESQGMSWNVMLKILNEPCISDIGKRSGAVEHLATDICEWSKTVTSIQNGVGGSKMKMDSFTFAARTICALWPWFEHCPTQIVFINMSADR